MAPHSSTLAWKIPWAEEPGRLWSMGSLRVGHDWVTFTFTFHFHALEKEMATHSSALAWKIPGMEEPGGLPSMGSHRAGHNWHDLAAAAAPHIWIQTLLHPLLSYKSSHFTNFFFLLLPPLGSNHTSYVGHLLKKAKIRHQEVYQLAQDKAHYFKSLL